MSQKTGYSHAQIVLHWLTAIAVLVAFFTRNAMGEIAHQTWEAGASPHPTPHTIAGFLVLALVIIRLVLRHRHGAPEPQSEGLMRSAAIWGHRALYALLIAVPVLGFFTWIIGIHDLSGPHSILGKAIMALALGHAVMAIFHQFIHKDGTLTRMLRPQSKD